jgi:3-oxoacyl-[acyl-carrier protein] reductase
MTGFGRVLDGKSALIVGGGGHGIGRAITRAFSEAGARLAVADVDPVRAREAADEVNGVPLVGDVRQMSTMENFVKQLDRLDILVTVVGGQVAFVPAVRLHEMRDEDWDLVYEMNLRYVVRAAKAAITKFLDQGTKGTIVSVGSVVGIMGAPMQAGYGAAKAGLASLARTVSAEYAGDGIRMNVVTCGAIATAVANAGAGNEDVPEIPMRRLGLPADAANAAVFLASPLSGYMTGQSVVVDGGVSTRGPFTS